MKKKQDEKAKQKNPVEVQETPAEKETQEAEQPAEQSQEKPDEQPAQKEKQEEAPKQEEEASDDAQAEETGEGAEPEQEAPEAEEAPAEEQPTAQPEESDSDENAQLKAELLTSNSKLAAYAAGVRQDMIEDAVTLATAQAQASGEGTLEAVTKAMDEVLKRHPEWKAEPPSKKKTGGFKLGADPDAAAGRKSGKTENTEKKRWNRFK